ncbi:MAG: alpha/beta fold hydrolase [Kofleriaceae bacterium]
MTTPTLAGRARAAARRAELTFGRVQLELLQRGLAAAAGLSPLTIETSIGPIAAAVRSRPGDPAPLVCVHGFGGDKETWLLLAPRLARGRGLVLLDLPGHGASASIAGPDATPGRYAAVVGEVLDYLGLARVVMVGNSLGGGVSLRLAADQPDRIAALVLIASIGPHSAASATVTAWRDGDNPLIPDDSEAAAEAFLRLVTERPPRVPRAILRYVASRRAGADVRLRPLFDGFATATGRAAVPTALGAVRAPALVMHGACDRVVPTTTAEELATELPNAELRVLAGVGHAPQLEAPGPTARAMATFLAAHDLVPTRGRR